MKKILFVNPSSDIPTYFSAEVLSASGFPRAAHTADLAVVTLAALASPFLDVAVCDENASPLNFEVDTDCVGITGKITQRQRMIDIATQFRARGKIVIIGGPCASLSPEYFRSHCDVLVRGEIEEIASKLFADLAGNSWVDAYEGVKADLAHAPIPRWDLYPNHRAFTGTIQISRGCPFDCEFCDVIQYLGRKQRWKPVELVLKELDVMYAAGYRSIFIADDNFTAVRARAREMVEALAAWNTNRPQGPVRFMTQVSIEVGKDEALLEGMAQAGLRQVFIGIETPNAESLRESRKRQNLKIDLVEFVERFLHHGISVYSGLIVGFDHDGVDIFERQRAFAMSLPVPIMTLGALVAPAATPLNVRLRLAGRLVEGPEVAAMPWYTNIIPARMSQAELSNGLRRLCTELYSPENFQIRIDRTMDLLRGRLPTENWKSWSPVHSELHGQLRNLVMGFAMSGEAEGALVQHVVSRMESQPEARNYIFPHLFQYVQIRHMYDYFLQRDSAAENMVTRRRVGVSAELLPEPSINSAMRVPATAA